MNGVGIGTGEDEKRNYNMFLDDGEVQYTLLMRANKLETAVYSFSLGTTWFMLLYHHNSLQWKLCLILVAMANHCGRLHESNFSFSSKIQ